jgi:flagellar assembly protein FliH
MSSKIIRATSESSKNVASFSFHALAKTENHSGPSIPLTPNPNKPVSGIEMASSDFLAVEQKSESLIRQAQIKASEIEKDAYEKGFAEGQKAGQEVGENMMEALLKQYAKSLEELRKLRKDVFVSSEREVIRLALEVAKKLIKREVVLDEELILTLVKVALSRAAEQTVLTVRVNSKDYQVIQRYQSAQSSGSLLNDGVKLIEDSAISRGGCLIETESGLVDARIEEQLREIEKGFLN